MKGGIVNLRFYPTDKKIRLTQILSESRRSRVTRGISAALGTALWI
jgi:hypothetical protein